MSDEALNPTLKSEALEAALASVWQRQAELGVVARRPGKRAIESDLKAALRELIPTTLISMSPGLTLLNREYTLDLAEWPSVGGVDLAVIGDDQQAAALIELKFRGSELWHLAWDVAKMGLCARLAVAPRTYLVAAAETESWFEERPGHGLFRCERWDTAAFLDQHRAWFESYRRRPDPMPRRLPDELVTRLVADHPFQHEGQEWLLRAIEVQAPGQGWLEIDEDLESHPIPSGDVAEPQVIESLEELSEPPTSFNQLAADEGGSIHLLGECELYSNETAAVAMLDPDDEMAPLHVRRFKTSIDRELYARERGWLRSRRRPELPGALAFSYSDMQREMRICFRLSELVVEARGQTKRGSPPTESWERFWAELDEIGVWSWRRWYSPIQWATDGEGWSFLAAHDDRLVSSRGYRAFPPDGSTDFTHAARLLAALTELAKGHVH